MSQRYFLTAESTYEDLRQALNVLLQYPNTLGKSVFQTALYAPRDNFRRVLLAVDTALPGYATVNAAIQPLLDSDAMEEVDEATYLAAVASATGGGATFSTVTDDNTYTNFLPEGGSLATALSGIDSAISGKASENDDVAFDSVKVASPTDEFDYAMVSFGEVIVGAAIGSSSAHYAALLPSSAVVYDTDAGPDSTEARATLGPTSLTFWDGVGGTANHTAVYGMDGITFKDNTTQTTAAVSYSLPTATDSVLGGVKIGSGVTITDGVISVSTSYAAVSHTHSAGDVTAGSTAGLVIVTTTGGALSALAQGTAGQVLKVNSGATGVEWGAADVDVRHDTVSSTTYTGRAAPDSATSASVWKIRRTVYSGAGAVSSTGTATNVKWDDRLTASYS